MPTEIAPSFGSTIEVAERTWLVVGRPMNLKELRADVANVLVHAARDALYVVDTGATPEFRASLLSMLRQAGAARRVILVNTHGHPDHVGNNGVVHELDAAGVEHWLPRRDLPIMRDPARYFADNFGEVDRYQALPFAADQLAEGMRAMFDPFDLQLGGARVLEDRPLAALAIGGASWPGWRIAEDLWVLRSGGHTAGEVVVYLPRAGVLHLADETNTEYPSFHDSDPDKALATLQRTLAALASGAVDAVTDGHHFVVRKGADASAFVEQLVDDYYALDRAVHEALAGKGSTFEELHEVVNRALSKGGLHGESENRLFSAMRLIKKLGELGASATGDDLRRASFVLGGAPELNP